MTEFRQIMSRQFNMETPCVVTFGKFDGVHKGHRLLIQKAVQLAKSEGIPSVVCSFDMKNWRGGIAEQKSKLTTSAQRQEICKSLGVDILYEYPFDDDIAGLSPDEFLNQFVHNKLQAKYVVVGTDWHFGKGREGDIKLLKELENAYQYEAVIVDKELYEGREISSSWIREEVTNGNMEMANMLLGYPYTFQSVVEHGKALGHDLGCPTVNQHPGDDKLLPPFGVYTSKVVIGGIAYPAVTNVGVRPTVSNSGRVSVETNILDWNETIYGENISVELYHFVRPEMKFHDKNELMAQLSRDIQFAKNYFTLPQENA